MSYMKHLLMLFGAISILLNSSAQLSGNYTIGGTTPDYFTMNDAVIALTTNGVNGPVVFNIRTGNYIEQFVIQNVTGVSMANSITFQSETGDSSDVVLEYSVGGTGSYLFRVSQVDYVHFNQLTFKTKLTGNQHRITDIYDTQGGTFTNCRFIGSADANNYEEDLVSISYGVGVSFSECRFDNGFRALKYVGNTSSTLIDVDVHDCLFYNFEESGVYAQDAQDVVIERNYFNTNNNRNPRAIELERASGVMSVIENKMEMFYFSTVSGGQYGIYINDATVTDGLVANNMVYIDGNKGGANGIGISGTNIDVVYNTIRLRKDIGYNCYAFTGGVGCRVLNNIFVAEQSPVVFAHSGADTVDFNDIYTDGSVDWTQNINGLGPNNYSVAPGFISSSDLHIYPTQISNSGTPIAGVLVDFDGEPRHLQFPDIGADEIPALALDASMDNILTPINDSVYCSGLNDITANLANLGTDTLVNATISLYINGSLYSSINWTGSLPEQGTEVVNLGTYPFVDATSYNIMVEVTNPNGGVDGNSLNDNFTYYDFHLPLNGIYTLGGATPDFASFRALENALEYGGLCGAVTVNVRTGSYHDFLYLKQLPGSSEQNHLTIQSEVGDSTAVEIWEDYPSTVAFTVRFEDVGNITLKDIRIRNNGAVPNNVIELVRAHDINILNSQVYGYGCSGCSSQSGKLLYGIYVDSNLVVKDVFFISGTTSVLVSGNDNLGAASRNFVFENNSIGGFDLYDANEVVIKNNTIGGAFNRMDNCDRFQIEKNTFYGGLAFFGCNGVDSTSYFRNNLVFARETGGASSSWDWALFLYSGSNFSITHNTIKTEEWAGCVHYSGTNIKMYNNIFHQTNANVSPHYMYSGNGGLSSDYNIYWTDNVNNPLVNLQGIYGLDNNSALIDPVFNTHVDSVYWPTNPMIDNRTDSTWGLPDDRFGQLRDTYSDPGAIEQSFAPSIDLGPDRNICTGESFGVFNGGYSYLWNTGDTSSHLIADTSGTFIVQVSNGLGTDSDTITISVFQNPIISLPDSVWLCAGQSTILEINQSNLTFDWSNGTTDSIATYTGTQMASVTVTNVAGCSAQANTYVSNFTLLNVGLMGTDESCFGNNNGTIDLNILSGDSTFAIDWSHTTNTDTLLTNLPAGWYNVTVTDIHGCSVTDSVEILPGSNFSASIVVSSSLCQFDSVNINGISNGGITHDWYVNSAFIGSSFDIGHAFDTAGIIDVMLVATNGSCIDTAYAQVDVMHDTICNPPGYCSPTYANGTTDGDFIDGVVCDSINNTGTGSIGGGSYQNYSSMSTTINPDSTYNVTIISGDYQNDFYGVWIDYNQDEDFDDVGEQILSPYFESLQSFESHSFNFTVPSNALIGLTVMRVVCTYSESDMAPCPEDAGYGETEDYTILIANPASDTTGIMEVSQQLFSLYPNPSNGSFIIESISAAQVEVFSMNGQLVHSQSIISGSNIFEIELSSGAYIVKCLHGNNLIENYKLMIQP